MKEQLLNKLENIVAKGNIVHYEQFLNMSQCFKKSSAAEASESVCMWESVNVLGGIQCLIHEMYRSLCAQAKITELFTTKTIFRYSIDKLCRNDGSAHYNVHCMLYASCMLL